MPASARHFTRAFDRLKSQVVTIASLLEEKEAIPAVAKHMELIQDLHADEWWVDVTVPILEVVRRRLRDVAGLIDKAQRVVLFSDFEDEMGEELEIAFEGLGETHDFERFRAKARAFMRAHEHHVAIQRLRMNVPLTPSDLDELERMLRDAGGGDDDLEEAVKESENLGVFVRSLVGLDREAAKAAFAEFLSDTSYTANQIEFVTMIIDHLTQHGVMDPSLLYSSPFTDVTPQGPDAIFDAGDVDNLVSILEKLKRSAHAA